MSILKRAVSILVLLCMLISLIGSDLGMLTAYAADDPADDLILIEESEPIEGPEPMEEIELIEEIELVEDPAPAAEPESSAGAEAAGEAKPVEAETCPEAEGIGPEPVPESEPAEKIESSELLESNSAAAYASGSLTATADGRCTVTVSFDEDARIPADASLTVTAIRPGSADYESFVLQSEDALEREGGNAVVLDIAIVAPDGEHIQPEAPVEVSIRMADASFDEATGVVHFAGENGDEPEVLETVADGAVAFTTDGFSVYVIVPAPEPVPLPGAAQSLDELAEGQGFRLSISTAGNTYYALPETNTQTAGFTLISRTTDEASAGVWYFEVLSEGEYAIYWLDGETRQYIHVDQVWNTKFSFSGTEPTAFRAALYNTKPGAFYLYLVSGGKNYALNLKSNDSGKGFQLYNADNGKNSGSCVTLSYADMTLEDDPYALDGRSFGIMNYKSGTGGSALLASETGISAAALSVRTDPMQRSAKLFVARDSAITLWSFHAVAEDKYTLSATVGGTEKYLRIESAALSLCDTPDERCLIEALPGRGSREGQIRFLGVESGKAIRLSGSGFTVGSDNGDAEWMRLAELSVYTEVDFVNYSAAKLSVSDRTNVANGKAVVLYTRVWNDSDKAYEFYVVDHNGDLVRAYESGDAIVWIGAQINTATWDFTEYYYEGTTEPNYYYELRNTYSGLYLAPQIRNGQLFSAQPIGINLNGRRYGDFYSAILAWDDPCYDYAGLKAVNGALAAVPMAQADHFYFAVMQSADPNALTEVQTVDHSASGMTVKIVDFDGPSLQNSVLGNSDYSASKTAADLLTTSLGADGYPAAALTGRSLAELFGGAREVNHLFVESTYHGSGYYEFDSTRNFASLREDGNFTVYQELGTIDAVHKNTLDHGQFMPFNDLTPGLFSEKHPYNTRDALARELSEDNPRKYERLYAIPEGEADYYFGVEIEASFMQTANGHDAWGHDIIFEFTGDDDFWLYVDGELLIDLGGVHGALPGSVNYSTGEVRVNGKSTTIYELFRSNFAAREGLSEDDPAVTARLESIFKTNAQGKRVFKDYTAHTMRIFFMERGAGASNLKMRFNLAAVTPGQVLLSKEISGTDKQDYASVKFPFQIRYNNGNGEHLLSPDPTAATPITVTYLNSAEAVEYAASHTADGVSYEHVFFLKPGQTAAIKVPDNTIEYWITECGVNTGIYDSVSINGEAAEGVEAGANSRSYTTAPASVSERVKVVFVNHVDESNLRTLTVTKRLLDAEGAELSARQDDTGFRFRISLGEALEPYRLGSYHVKDEAGCYCVYDAESRSFVSTGKAAFAALSAAERTAATFTTSPSGAADRIPAGYSLEIRGLLVGTRFKIEEREDEIPEGYSLHAYERMAGSYYTDLGDTENAGTIRDNSDPHIVVTNRRGWGLTVNKRWSDESMMEAHGDVHFAVYVGGELLDGSLRTLRCPETELRYFFASITGSFADYQVREVLVDGESVTALAEGESLLVSGRPVGGETADYTYVVSYTVGNVGGKADNVRTDTVTNTRPGLTLVKTDSSGQPVAGAVFELRKGDALLGSFVSGADGVITTVYPEQNRTYTLTETAAPRGFRGLRGPLSLTQGDGLMLAGADAASCIHSGDMLLIPNLPFTLRAVKVDAESGAPLSGAHFALYRLVQGVNGPMRDYYPIAGFEDLVSGADGVIAGLDESLAPGGYCLVETQAPEYYTCAEEPFVFTVSERGTVTADSGLTEEDGAFTITLPNAKLVIENPAPTGLSLRRAPFALILLAGAALVLMSRRRQAEDGSDHRI